MYVRIVVHTYMYESTVGGGYDVYDDLFICLPGTFICTQHVVCTTCVHTCVLMYTCTTHTHLGRVEKY